MRLKTNTVASVSTPQNADSVALFGHPITNPDSSSVTQALVVGTYTLQQTQNPKRTGSALVLHAKRDQTPSDSIVALETKPHTPLPGVLDVCSHESQVYAACADDSVARLSSHPPYVDPSADVIVPPAKSELLTLSLDVTQDTETSIATSHSSGHISLYSATPAATKLLDRRKSHTLEAWTVCRRNHILYSGGDDGALVAWTPNSPENIFRLRAPHEGIGVTAVAVQPGDEHELWTGGYDDTLRIWDTRYMRRCLTEANVGGGVWRIKYHPKGLVLIATMYDGFKVVRREEETLDIVARYDKHESIAYGAAWVPALDSGSSIFAVTASFYDCSVRLWSVSTTEEGKY